MTDLNPQARQMADESMLRTLDAQARAIWPQEATIFQRYELPAQPRVLDAGCGTGEGTARIAQLFAAARVLGVDVLEEHLERARLRCAGLGDRVRFARASIFELQEPDGSFDLALCRHVLHSIPFADRAIAELARVTRPGGYLHLIAEDYGMLHFQRGRLDARDFWHDVPPAMGEATNTDLFVGRNAFAILQRLGFSEIAIDYAIVDTLRVPRETFAAIIEAWRDGYAEWIGTTTPLGTARALDYFNDMIATILDPHGYAVWMVPIVSARVPPAPGAKGEGATAVASAAAAANRSTRDEA
ncbi:MAG TPA: methyltransferase domain-containing protein [Candidatus Cybelea sp.]|nr:methyltransferase domain-containing protein [Candidatus Cybelea sp.]